MKESFFVFIILACSAIGADTALDKGKKRFAQHCSACHHPKGSGLIGPNLTDKEFKHGSKPADFEKVIRQGVPGTIMTPKENELNKKEIDVLVKYLGHLKSLNLKSTVIITKEKKLPLHLPTGSETNPYVLRTFMPLMGIKDDVFPNHFKAAINDRYARNDGSKKLKGTQKPVHGVISGIAVNFGQKLSYCFDATECRLLYVWTNGFVNMKDYWGEGRGGGRRQWAYFPKILGDVVYITKGTHPFKNSGKKVKPRYLGYRKVNNVPEFMVSYDGLKYCLKIEPVENGWVRRYKIPNAKDSVTLTFSADEVKMLKSDKGKWQGNKLVLTAKEASEFSITAQFPKEVRK